MLIHSYQPRITKPLFTVDIQLLVGFRMLRHVKTSANWRCITPLKTQMTITNWKSSPVWRGDTSEESLKTRWWLNQPI